MNKILEALRRKLQANVSARSVAQVVGISPTTVARYVDIYLQKKYVLEELEQLTYEELDALFNKARGRLIKRVMPDFAEVYRRLKQKHATLEREWEEYRLVYPKDGYSQSHYTALYAKFAKKLDVVMRQTHRAGEVVFVDFAGTRLEWTDSATGTKHYAHIFVAVLGCSNYTFFYAVPDQTLESWIECHVELFRFLGGVPEIIVCDNLKAAVTKPYRDLMLNRTYADLGRHYGSVIMPARPYRPRDKAPVEAGVRFVSRWVLLALKPRTYFSVNEINKDLGAMRPGLNERSFKKLPGTRKSWFEELDRPALKPLPSSVFEYAEWVAPRKVPSDYHVPVGRHYYSVPNSMVEGHVEARVTSKNVEFYSGGKRVATHLRNNGLGTTTLPEHQTPAHRAQAEQSPDKYKEWAKDVGPAALALVMQQFVDKPHTLIGIRACSSLKNLARNYGPERFEAACQRALDIGSPIPKSVRSILQRGLDAQKLDEEHAEVSLPAHQNIRGRDYYTEVQNHV